MSGEVLYLDSSAIVKLVVIEDESGPMHELVAVWPLRVSSTLGRVEMFRALRRRRVDDETMLRGEAVAAKLEFIGMSDSIIQIAGALDPPELRALDAIHLATALSLGAKLGSFVTYDDRLDKAAKSAGLRVLAPA